MDKRDDEERNRGCCTHINFCQKDESILDREVGYWMRSKSWINFKKKSTSFKFYCLELHGIWWQSRILPIHLRFCQFQKNHFLSLFFFLDARDASLSLFCIFLLRNDICTTILWQLLDNFLYHTHIIFLLSHLFSLSIVFDQ